MAGAREGVRSGLEEAATGAREAGESLPPGKEGTFNTGAVLTVSAAHGVNDAYSFMLPPLLPLLIIKFGIPLAAAGALVAILKGSALVQPIFGVWADRVDARVFVIAAPVVTALGISLLGVAPSYQVVVLLLLISGLGAAAFHPAGAAAATYAAGGAWGRGSSFYMAGAEVGRAAGPLLIVAVVTWFGLESSYLAALPAIALSSLLYLQFRRGAIPKRRGGSKSTASIWATVKAQKRSLLLLAGVVFFRSTSVFSFAAFYPTHVTSLGASLAFAGLAVSIYEVAGAGGAMVGGTLSDRFGRRASLVVSQLLTGPVLYMALVSWDGAMGLVFMAAAGALAVSASPVQLTLAQELLPGSRSTAASIVFFLGFEGTLVATLAVGALGDWIGLSNALSISVLVSMLSIPFTLALPEPRRSS